MEVITWEKVSESSDNSLRNTLFSNGSAVTVGSFDGPHIAHKIIFEHVISAAKKLGISAVIITFYDPLPAIKHSENYLGDIATFNQRLNVYENIGFDYCVVVDFSFNFSKIEGRDFLNLMEDALGVRYIAEGVDFHFGCNGAYRVDTIESWAVEMGVETDFIDLVTCQKLGFDRIGNNGASLKDTARISSSYIRQCIKGGRIKDANKFLCEPYRLDFTGFDGDVLERNEYGYSCPKMYFTQVTPDIGSFDADVLCRGKNGNSFLLRGCLEASANAINLVGLTGSDISRIESVRFD